jgi:hypothetical protein
MPSAAVNWSCSARTAATTSAAAHHLPDVPPQGGHPRRIERGRVLGGLETVDETVALRAQRSL